MKIRVWPSKSYGYTEGCSDLQRSGRAGSETLCVCAVGCIYNTRLSVTTASVLLLWCTSLEEVLFIKDFKTSSPCCAFPSCLCSQELLKLVIAHVLLLFRSKFHHTSPPPASSGQTGQKWLLWPIITYWLSSFLLVVFTSLWKMGFRLLLSQLKVYPYLPYCQYSKIRSLPQLPF